MKKRSIIWSISDDEFINLVDKSNSIADILRFFGLRKIGGNYNTCKKRLKYLHLEKPKGYIDRRRMGLLTEKVLFEKHLIEGSRIESDTLKKYLIRFHLKTDVCDECGLSGIWNSKPIVLQLDHKNGVGNDNRLENLRLLCPNCHSQTKTFCGKNKK